MVTPKRYKSAPITEAVIEIRLRPGPADADLKTLAESLKPDFPNQAPIRVVQSRIRSQSEAPEFSMSQTIIGWRLSNGDNSRALQIKTDGLAYSHLAPYSDWQTFRKEALPLWERYRGKAREGKLVRCALRYINRVDIPGEKVDLFEYFNVYPRLPTEMEAQDYVSFAVNVQVPQSDLECMVIINQAASEPVKRGHVSIILDIDIFRLGIEEWQDSEAWAFLDKLRDRKNEIFERSITDRTRELIDR